MIEFSENLNFEFFKNQFNGKADNYIINFEMERGQERLFNLKKLTDRDLGIVETTLKYAIRSTKFPNLCNKKNVLWIVPINGIFIFNMYRTIL